MNIIQTDYQKELAKLPAELDVLRELFRRKGLNDHEIEALYLLELENKAQMDLLQVINQHGNDDWLIIRDIEFNTATSPVSCDLVLITQSNLYTFTLNTYEKKTGALVNQPTKSSTAACPHLIYNVIRLNDFLYEIFDHELVDVSIESHLVYMQSDTKIEVEDYTSSCKITSKDYLVNMIKNIVDEEKEATNIPLDKREIFGILEKYEKTQPIEPQSITELTKLNIQPGMCCRICSSFNIYIGQHYIACECGSQETLEKAILRTICEYGVIHFNKNLEVFEVINFFADQISPLSIIGVLNKFFIRM
jgi:hypothetical protein